MNRHYNKKIIPEDGVTMLAALDLFRFCWMC